MYLVLSYGRDLATHTHTYTTYAIVVSIELASRKKLIAKSESTVKVKGHVDVRAPKKA